MLPKAHSVLLSFYHQTLRGRFIAAINLSHRLKTVISNLFITGYRYANLASDDVEFLLLRGGYFHELSTG